MTTIILTPEAIEDAETQYAYLCEYASIKKAEEFRDEIDDSLDKIEEYPVRHSPKGKYRRNGPTEVFNFSVYYQYNEETDVAIIVAIAHPSREPFYWEE